jgi:hypothetical protein
MEIFITQDPQGGGWREVAGFRVNTWKRAAQIVVPREIFARLAPRATRVVDSYAVSAKELAKALQLPYSEAKAGVWEGPGHGAKVARIGDLEIRKIVRCEGAGRGCSYDHGPFVRRYAAD